MSSPHRVPLRVMAIRVLIAVVGLVGAAAARASNLPERLPQGGTVILQLAAGESARLDGRTLRVSDEGWVVFGAGRDASQPLRFERMDTQGTVTRSEIRLVPRDFRIERVDGLPQQTVTPDPALAARIAREQALVTRARERDDARADFAAGFVRPVAGGRISGVYGSQRILNGEPRAPHMGLDIAVPTGTPITAPAAGIISFAEPDLYLTGGTVLLDHGHGLSSSFLHLSKIDVQPGQRVERGERIGAVGATGRASGPHLHWGLNWFDTRLDPALLIP
ncbi:M23 family metallopeptidase [Aquimonas sp.]|jgi:murein DD-endopeptidase MepM/ murein hydrolase activator NlpD|uniref:M23 family metallopeptidase n=1 Tax=Aquimonas sp. TaxID=1872588 RepID=UPI0037BE829C